MNEQTFLAQYPVSDTEVIIGSHKIAMLLSVTEKTSCKVREHRAFGDNEVSCLSCGEESYEIKLERTITHDRLRFNKGAMLYPLVIKSKEMTVTYGRCKCVSIETAAKLGEPPAEKVTIIAQTREEAYNE